VETVRAAVGGVTEALEGADEATRSRLARPHVVAIDAAARAGEHAWADLVAETGRPTPAPDDPEALAVLLYTSGTSGRPRAAMLSHRALLANIRQVAQVEPPMIHGNDVVFGVLPLFHVYGLNAVLGQLLSHQARMVLVEGFDPEGALDIIEDEAITVLPVAPPVFAYWRAIENLGDRLGPLRLALSGSAPLSVDLIEWFTGATGVVVHQGYGLTEASPVVSAHRLSGPRKIGSVGQAIPGVEVSIQDDGDRPLPVGEVGEVCVRGRNVMAGYYRNPEETARTVRAGWLHTGDMGRLDEDGFLFIVERKKDLIIRGGFNIYPREVEETLYGHPKIAEAAVVGMKDPLMGEDVLAFVVLRSGEQATEAEIAAFCERRLARFKCPKQVRFLDALPKSPIGKILRKELRTLA
jgi:long-chain acyl-CoA synthetase